MNEFSSALIWCILQTSLVAAITVILVVAFGQRFRGSARAITMCGILGLLVLTLFAWSPWPRWTLVDANVDTEDERAHATVDDVSEPQEASVPQIDRSSDAATLPVINEADSAPATKPQRPEGQAPSFWDQFTDEFESTRAAVSVPDRRWMDRLAVAMLLLISLGIIRFAVGLLGLRRLINRAEEVRDNEFQILVAQVAKELGFERRIRILMSTRISTAATVGWMTPTLLLPADWNKWSPGEKRSVVAHELAHMQRGDFMLAAIAQFCLAVHFYHPLVHWMVRRLRLEMEFDADTLAAESIGSSPQYATTLAGMAIRDNEQTLGWPARTFLPTRNTFLRRLEMLRSAPRLPARSPVFVRWLCVALVLVSITSALGLRGSLGLEPTAENELANKPIQRYESDLAYVPKDASIVVTFKLAEIMQIEAFEAFTAVAFDQGLSRMDMPFEPTDVARMTIFATDRDIITPSGPSPFAQVFSFIEPQNKMWLEPEDQVEEKTFLLHKYYSARSFSWMQPDENTLVVGSEDQIKVMIVNGSEVSHEYLSGEDWSNLDDPQVGVCFSTAPMKLVTQLEAEPAWASAFAPLWEDAQAYVAGMSWSDELNIRGTVICDDAESAESVEETLSSVLTLGRNAARQLRVVESEDGAQAALMQAMSDNLQALLDSTELEVTSGNRVTAAATLDIDQRMIAMLAEATTAAQSAASRTQDINNVKQIMLAMHNYHDVHKHLPPAIVYHETASGERVARSWRVELLPYLEAAHLYDAYRKDEPWDSEHNREILAQMPSVFRSSADRKDSTNSSYFVLVGDGTLFGIDEGARFRDVTDGLSNTIAVIDAKRDIPWTKPMDIEWSGDASDISFGDWHQEILITGFADGSVRVLHQGVDPAIFEALIGIRDGINIDYNRLDR